MLLYKHILRFLCKSCVILPLTVNAEMYLELGVGIVAQEMSQPEYLVSSPMGRVTFGNTIGDWSIELEHTSSINEHEKGAGLNVLWINRRFVLD